MGSTVAACSDERPEATFRYLLQKTQLHDDKLYVSFAKDVCVHRYTGQPRILLGIGCLLLVLANEDMSIG